MKTANDILHNLEAISLNEMDSVKLMDRTDTKFIFTIEQFDKIIHDIKDHYRVLEVEGKRKNRYKTLYYDTGNFNLYLAHHNGRLNRYKIRHRTYVESNAGFLEVKFKNNKGRTIKNRIKEHDPPLQWQKENETFLLKTQPFAPEILKPVIWVNYARYTLVNKLSPERLTLDVELEFERENIKKELRGLVIAEVKQEKRIASPFVKMMKQYRIPEESMSKYCIGISLTCDHVKKNNFKEKLLTLKQLINYDYTANT